MEKTRLQPELQTIIDQFSRFRNEYSSLKTHYAAQEELIKLQKLELEQMRFSVEQLASTLIEYQKRFNTTLGNLESENQRLQKTIDNLNRECENTRVNDHEYIQEVHRTNDEYSRRLEEHLEELRSKIAAQDEKHEEQVKCIEKRHNEEIANYRTKIEGLHSLEKLHSEDIFEYKSKLEKLNASEKRHSEEISSYKKKLEQMNSRLNEEKSENKKKSSMELIKRTAAHPAFTEDTGNKRKKSAPAAYRWQPLEVSTEKKVATTQSTVQKKKKLYQADNETIVDLGS